MRRRRFRVVTNEQARTTYLGRKLDNWDWVKEAPDAELKKHIQGLGYKFASDPWSHQLQCFTIGAECPDFLFYLKMGGGKSKIFLDQARYRKRRGELLRAIVAVPKLLHVTGWEEQIKTHAPDLQYRLLVGDRGEREALMRKPPDICVVNFAGLQVYMTHMVKKRGAQKATMEINKDVAAEFVSMFNMMGIDEIHRVVARDSVWFDMLRWLSVGCDFRYAFSGTSFGRDPTPLFNQFMLIDQGATLGSHITPFRNAFFTPREDYWSGVKWEFNKETAGDLNRIIKNRSIVYTKKELQANTPPKIPVRVPLRMSAEQAAYYRRVKDSIVESRGDYKSLQNVFLRMRQVASGFVAMKADDDSRIQIEFKEQPKLEACREILESKPEEKFLIFHEYRHSGRVLESMLTKAKIPHVALRGGVGNAQQAYTQFLTDKKCRAFVLNNESGSENINPQYVCSRIIVYESPTDPKIREQMEGRIDRSGQRFTTWVHDLVMIGTIEQKILDFHREGRDLQKAVMNGEDIDFD